MSKAAREGTSPIHILYKRRKWSGRIAQGDAARSEKKGRESAHLGIGVSVPQWPHTSVGQQTGGPVSNFRVKGGWAHCPTRSGEKNRLPLPHRRRPHRRRRPPLLRQHRTAARPRGLHPPQARIRPPTGSAAPLTPADLSSFFPSDAWLLRTCPLGWAGDRDLSCFSSIATLYYCYYYHQTSIVN